MARARPARWATAGSMCTVWNAPATLSGMSRARVGGFAAKAASCSVVPAATIWPVPLLFAAVRPWASSAASTSSGWPPMTAVIEVGALRTGRGHRPAALADEDHGLFGREHADPGGGGDLADGVTGGHADVGEGVRRVGEQLQCGEQTGGDQQRLGDRGVADGLGVGLGPVVRQIEPGDGGQPAQPGGEGGLGRPWPEESGCLRTLTGCHDGEHTFTIS